MALEISWLMAGLLTIFLCAGTIKGALGVGLPTSAISLSTLVIDPKVAVALVVFPIFAANGWQIFRQGQFARIVRRYWIYALCIWGSLWISAQFAGAISGETVSVVMGIAVIAFVIVSFLQKLPPLPARLDRFAQAITGLASGALGGIAGVWAPPVAMYLLSKNLEREEFVRVTGFMLGMGAFPLVIGYFTNGVMVGALPWISALMILPTIVGFSVGERLRRHLNGPRFRQAILLFFLVMGLNMLRRGLV